MVTMSCRSRLSFACGLVLAMFLLQNVGALAHRGATAADGCRADYVIGAEDVLDIAVWENTALTRTVPVRPDGKISLPLLDDVQAAGLTPMQLRERLVSGARRVHLLTRGLGARSRGAQLQGRRHSVR